MSSRPAHSDGKAERLVLHIGKHKTGSSALQYHLKRHRRALMSAGVLYPKPHQAWLGPVRSAHHALIFALFGTFGLAKDVRARLGARPEEASRAMLDQVRADLRRHPIDALVISSEAFFQEFPEEARVHLSATAKSLARNLHTICYIRHPVDYAVSALSTMVQRAPDLSLVMIRTVLRRLEVFARVPENTLIVRPFDQASFDGGSLLTDFCCHALPEAATLLQSSGFKRLNQTLSSDAMDVAQEFGFAVGASMSDPVSKRHQVFRALLPRVDQQMLGYRRPTLKPGMHNALVAHSQGYREIKERFGCTIEGLDYDLAGQGVQPGLKGSIRVGDLFEVDEERRAKLRSRLAWLFPTAVSAASPHLTDQG
ncbi:MAG: hypothetical protein AAF748_09285 [Pseudomonadota bacterium]